MNIKGYSIYQKSTGGHGSILEEWIEYFTILKKDYILNQENSISHIVHDEFIEYYLSKLSKSLQKTLQVSYFFHEAMKDYQMFLRYDVAKMFKNSEIEYLIDLQKQINEILDNKTNTFFNERVQNEKK